MGLTSTKGSLFTSCF